MTTLQALDCLRDGPRDWWPLAEEHRDTDIGLLLMAGAASLSGQLDDCKTEADVRGAVAHFIACYDAGIFTREQWAAEAPRIEQELAEWGRRVDNNQRCVAENN